MLCSWLPFLRRVGLACWPVPITPGRGEGHGQAALGRSCSSGGCGGKPDAVPQMRLFRNVLPAARLHVGRHGDRSRHREHAGLRQGPRHRARRAERGRHRRYPRQEAGAGGRRGGQADARPDARQHPGHPAAARRRHRRFRGGGGNDQAFHPQGAQPARLRLADGHRLRPLRLDRGRAPRHPGERRERRRAARCS